ncbi:hypothetical protein [Labrys miyagiensis]|uniref:hypothetical protein n=1 Tax=Labrys miyagiensis TaxID=346912 RepID=UPI0024E10D24|nr:hypothetical protein [Labrys miyagiensis]
MTSFRGSFEERYGLRSLSVLSKDDRVIEITELGIARSSKCDSADEVARSDCEGGSMLGCVGSGCLHGIASDQIAFGVTNEGLNYVVSDTCH